MTDQSRQRRMHPELTRTRTELRFPPEGPLRIVAVADTHSEAHERAHDLIARLAPHAILHAGDIGDLTVLDGLADIAPMFAVRGNIDERVPSLPDVLCLDVVAEPAGAARLSILLFHIALAGPRIRADAARLVREERANLLVCGHSHVPFIGIDRGMAVLNPGSIGPRRYPLPIVFGVIDVPVSGIVHMHHVSCETGARWMP
jgi:putative phosphoesterase